MLAKYMKKLISTVRGSGHSSIMILLILYRQRYICSVVILETVSGAGIGTG